MVKIHEGQMLVRAKAVLPERVCLRGTSLTPGWLILEEDANGFVKQIEGAEWHLFWIPQRFRGWSFALDEQDALDGALCRAVNQVKPRYNSVEIAHIKERKLLGMFFCHIEVSSCHAQKSAILGLAEASDQLAPATVLAIRGGGHVMANGKSAA